MTTGFILALAAIFAVGYVLPTLLLAVVRREQRRGVGGVMAYSIRQGSVVLTVQQFRDVVTVLEAIRDLGDDGDAHAIASAALGHLKAEGLIAE